MKILLINDYSSQLGGAEINIQLLREGLLKKGHDARMFASTAAFKKGETPPDYSCFGTRSRFRTLLQTANPAAYFQLRRVLKEFQPDAVYTKIFLTQLSPLILPLLKKIPAVHHICWYRTICPKGTKFLPDETICREPAGAACYRQGCLPLRDWLPLMLQMRLYRRWKNSFNSVIAISSAVKERLKNEGFCDMEVIPYGYPLIPTTTEISKSPVICYAGRLVHEKGVEFLLRAFARVVAAAPQAQLIVAGEGPEEAKLKKLAADLKLSSQVSFWGFIDKNNLEPRLANAWVQAVPSLWEEPFGNVAVEAMLRRTAVVATRTGGLAEIIEDKKTGLLVSPGNVDELAEALLLLIKDTALRSQLIARAQETALKNYISTNYINRVESLLQNLVKRN